MEFTEAFRTEDISKTDFFDFVVTPEDMGNDIVLHNNFPWTRKSISLFSNNNNNNNPSLNNANTNGSAHGDLPDLRSIKHESNNNHMHAHGDLHRDLHGHGHGLGSTPTSSDSLPSFGDHTFWNTTASAKAAAAAAAAAVNVKMEGTSLGGLADICWSGGASATEPVVAASAPENNVKRERLSPGEKDDGNTDGSIYTLTVINGQQQQQAAAPNPPWYRQGPPDPAELGAILKEDEEHLRQAMSAIESSGHYQTSLDIESIISILPSLSGLPSMANDSHYDSLHDQDTFHEDRHSLFSTNNDSSPGEVMLGSSKLSVDSGFIESKDDVQSRLKHGPTPGIGTGQGQDAEDNRTPHSNGSCSFSENNNDWSFSNNEARHSAESLLRSALQGGKSFMSQYNGHQQPPGPGPDSKTLKCLDTHTELQAVQGVHTPPDHASLGLYMTNDVDGPSLGMIPVTMDNGAVLLFDDTGGGNGLMYNNAHSVVGAHTPPASTPQSMDDILLSPLDDYEKLKMIENEVAESAKRYGSMDSRGLDQSGHLNGLSHSHSPYGLSGPGPGPSPVVHGGLREPLQAQQQPPHSSAISSSSCTSSAPSQPTSVPSEPKKKKSVKKSCADRTTTPSAAPRPRPNANSANGVRRERSLHHCTVCSKAFKDKYSVNVHIRTHTGEKPFACSVCGKSFRQKAHLAKHYHTHIVQKASEPHPTSAGPGVGLSGPGHPLGKAVAAKTR